MKKKNSVLHEWQLKSRVRGTCGDCGRETDMLNVDHIIPASFLVNIGLPEQRYEDNENFQLLCRLCNADKSNRFDLKNPKTVPLLKKYINLLEEMSK